jgi:hypothetical protein
MDKMQTARLLFSSTMNEIKAQIADGDKFNFDWEITVYDKDYNKIKIIKK